MVLNKEQYVVVGVIKDRLPRGTTGGQSAEDFNRDVYIPIRTCRVRFGERIIIRQGGGRTGEQVEMHQVTLTINDIGNVRSTGDVVRNLLERYHNKKDWEVAVPLDRLEEAERARDRYNMLLALIASISLLVGGIGIMNIMLASILERTKEIGIRRAVGARQRVIIRQFLLEATLISCAGGLIGVGVGVGLSWLIGYLAGWTTIVSTGSILLAFCVSVSVGLVFGVYPARKAASLDPVKALHYE